MSCLAMSLHDLAIGTLSLRLSTMDMAGLSSCPKSASLTLCLLFALFAALRETSLADDDDRSTSALVTEVG